MSLLYEKIWGFPCAEKYIFHIGGDRVIYEYILRGNLSKGLIVELRVGDVLVDRRKTFNGIIKEFPVIKIFDGQELEVRLLHIDSELDWVRGDDYELEIGYEDGLIWERMGEQMVSDVYMECDGIRGGTYTELCIETNWKVKVNSLWLKKGDYIQPIELYDVRLDKDEILPDRESELASAKDYKRCMHWKRDKSGKIIVRMPLGGKYLNGEELVEADLCNGYRRIGFPTSGLRKINYGFGEKGFYVRQL